MINRKRTVSLALVILLVITCITPLQSVWAVEGSDSGGSTTIINNYYIYNNYYYIDEPRDEHVDIHSLNNKDEGAYWRPKYEDLNISLEEHVQYNNKDMVIDNNGFNVDWSEINKHNLPTSRALEILGYDMLLYKDSVNINTGISEKVIGYKAPITAPYLIMNVYKALGIEIYDTYFKFEKDSRDMGVYVTRTNPESYWELFLNDHPIDYSVYNDSDVNDITLGQVLNTEDAISIIAQMLDFYGEPVISKQEEYLLLQVYGDDVPNSINDAQKGAWSYLKCRGIIGEQELNYNSQLSFEDMIDMLMRVKDKESRTNFKEVQITTNLDNSFISNGYYESEVKLVNQPSVSPVSTSINWGNANRYDFLIEINNDVAFKFKDTGELNKDIFISTGPNHDDSPIKGSIFEGIKEGRFYHFSIPISELPGVSTVYVNSSKGGDIPLNYILPIKTNIGGVYSSYIDNEGSISYRESKTFNSTLDSSMYVDSNRFNSSKSKLVALASGNGVMIETRYSTELLDTEKSIKVIESLGGTARVSVDQLIVNIEIGKIGSSNTSSISNIISRKLVIKTEYKYTSQKTNAILGLTGSRLLVSLSEAKEIGLINGFKYIKDTDILIIYTKDNDVVIVDNKYKTIQKGNTYLQIKEEQDLFTYKNGGYLVDFRALYGTKEIGFNISNDSSTGETVVTMYSNNIVGNNVNSNNKTINRLSSQTGEYTYFSTKQYLPYTDGSVLIDEMGVDLLYKFNNTSTNNKLSSNIQEVLLPFSSSNPMGNYILYGEYDSDYGVEHYYLVTATPNKMITQVSQDKDYTSMFRYYPELLSEDNYTINVIKITTDNNYNIKSVPGIGWVKVLDKIDDSNNAKTSFIDKYLNKSNVIPYGYSIVNEAPRLFNFNINYITDSNTKSLSSLNDLSSLNSPIPAAIGMQAWFSNPKLIPTISKETIANKISHSSVPKMYWGTMPLEVKSNKSIVTKSGNISMDGYMSNLVLSGINRISSYTGDDSYSSPGIYVLSSSNLNSTLSSNKDDVPDDLVTKRSMELQKFFEQFDDISFKDFIYGLDNSMSIAYYIITRVVPLIIFSLLVIMILIYMVSDMKIVQLFCTKVFDPVKILTFGNYDIHTVRNKYLIFSLIGALTIMGIIQSGNLEKIIMFIIELYYAFMMLFE